MTVNTSVNAKTNQCVCSSFLLLLYSGLYLNDYQTLAIEITSKQAVT